MHMFAAEVYKERRTKLAQQVREGVILIYGNDEVPFNYAGNPYKFRQDSNFLYFFGIDEPGMAGLIDLRTGKSILFGNEPSVESEIWTGPRPNLKDYAERSGTEQYFEIAQLQKHIRMESTSKVHYLPPYPAGRKQKLAQYLDLSVQQVEKGVSISLIKAVVKLRSIKSADEVAQIELSLNNATGPMHIQAMKMANEGMVEYQIAGQMEGIMAAQGYRPSYGIICSIRGEILHNITQLNTLNKDQMLLIDAGAENLMHYASDITRTTPVGRKFNSQQAEIYQAVLDAQIGAIESIKPGIPYREIHMKAARIMAQALADLGLMKGNLDDAVKEGAHALFFPHGLGHQIGLDVHDMEDLGEDYVGYDEEIKRSTQFGTAYLRLGRRLEEGMVVTVEPGLYFIPGLINQWKSENKFEQYINYNKLSAYQNFGGVRIEDNILVTADGHKILGDPIPKSIQEIESL